MVVMAILTLLVNPGLIKRFLKSVADSVKSRIISSSLIFFITVLIMKLQSYKYITYMYLFTSLGVIGKRTHKLQQNFPSLVVLGSTVVQKMP